MTSDALLGRVLDEKYRIDAEIGAGGMATVYRATRLHIGDTVAIKVLHAELLRDPQFAERFRREAQTAARLKHPNVVAIYDFGVSSDGVIYFVMELVEGRSLRAIVREQGPMPAALAGKIVDQVCAALTEAHRQKIVHRDIKPANIVVESSSDGPRVKVLDFGIASLRDGAALGLTQLGDVLGTPAYMSPEQCLGEELDGRSDIYSVGVVLFEMLCGVVPFNSPTATAVVMQHVHQAPPPLRVLNVSVTPAVEAVVLRALAKRREDRFESARELAGALSAAVHGAHVSSAPDIGVKPAYPELERTMVLRAPVVVPPTRAPRTGIPTGIAIGAALAILIGAVWFGVQRTTTKPATVAVHTAKHRAPATARPRATAPARAAEQPAVVLRSPAPLPAVVVRSPATMQPALAATGEDPVALVRQYYALWNAREFAAMYAMLSVRLQRKIPYDVYVQTRLPILQTGVDAVPGDAPGVVNMSLVTRDRNRDGSISETYNAGQWFLATEGGRLKLNELRVHVTRPPVLVAPAPLN
jgi:eukaryotic-like serine/threonine-protein kinase